MRSRLKRHLAGIVLGSTALLAANGAAQAAPIDIGTWYEFLFYGLDQPLISGAGAVPLTNPAATAAPDPDWTFTIGAAGGELFVTDAFLSGDQFEIFNGLVSLGLTSVATAGGDCGSNLGCALSDSRFSTGSFALAPGSYSITGVAVASLSGGGAGAFRVVENRVQVPEPASLALLGAGWVVGFGLARRRKTG